MMSDSTVCQADGQYQLQQSQTFVPGDTQAISSELKSELNSAKSTQHDVPVARCLSYQDAQAAQNV